ncbi:MAG: DUF748 domain-containing protein [Desulfomicrobium sp.]|nr:DUF748 domain-containing protein [Desulfomicrobium sp.]
MPPIRQTWKNLTLWQKALAITACCAALYAAFGFLLLPRIANYVLVEKVGPALNRQISIGEIRINPFAMTADVAGFAISEPDGSGEFAAFDTLHANLELASIPRLALVVRDARVDGPRIHIRLDQDGQTNFSDLTAGSEESRPENQGESMLLPLIVEPFTVIGGTLTLEDQARGVSHVVDQIEFNLPHFSSRKKDWQTFMTPTLSFRVNGAPFNLQGQTTPFHDSLRTEFDLNVVDLGLPQYWAYALASENLTLTKGTLSLENKLVFERHEDRLPTFSLQGTITGRDIELTDDGEPVLSAASTEIILEDISILNLQLGLRSVSLENPFIKLVRKKDGSLNWMHYFVTKVDPADSTTNATDSDAAKEHNAPGSLVAQDGNTTGSDLLTPNTNATLAADAENATKAQAPEIDEATAARRETARTLLLQVPNIHLKDGHVLFMDESVSFTKELSSVNLIITDLDTSINATSQAELRVRTADGESLGANATFSIAPFRVQAVIEARDVDVPSYIPYFKDALPLTLAKAKAGTRLRFIIDGEDKAPRLDDSSIEISDMSLKAADGAGEITLDRAALDNIFLNLADNSVRAGVFNLEGATLSTGLDKQGRARLADALSAPASNTAGAAGRTQSDAAAWNLELAGASIKAVVLKTGDKAGPTPVKVSSLQVGPVTVDTKAQSVQLGPVELSLAVDLVRQASGDLNLAKLFAPGQAAPARPAAQAKASTPSWAVTVEQFSLAGTSVSLTDQTLAKPVRLDVDQITLLAKNLSTDLGKAVPLTLSCRVEETGTMTAAGDIVPATMTSKGSLTLSRIPLAVASAYVADVAAIDIPAGRLGGKLDWRMGDKAQDQISGSLQVDGLRVTEARSKTELLGFKSLGVNRLALQLSPLALTIAQVELVEPRGSFVIDAQGKTSLDRIAPTPQKKAPAKSADTSGGLKTLEIGTVSLKQGRFSFADRTLSPQFESVISPLDLTVTGFSLDPAKRTELDLTAIIDGSAPITAKGWVSPLKTPVEASSTVTLRNLDLVALSSYSSKFIAYPVARGQLDWEISMDTSENKLSMGNAIKARQLELGDKVESPGAADVPVKLGLALLRDMSGNITINLPVKGDLNDPKFSIGGIVMQAFLGLIVKAIASPFSLLASLVPDGGGEDLNRLPFPPGLSAPAPEALQNMQALAEILAQRPGIKISILGHADPAADRQAMADQQFMRKLQVIKFDDLPRKVRETTVLEALEITDEEYPDLLWDAYKDEPVEKEKNAIGIHREVSREVQEAKLRELIRVTDDDLVRLAATRAEFVKNHLVQELNVDAGRIFMGKTGPQALSGAHEATVEIQP